VHDRSPPQLAGFTVSGVSMTLIAWKSPLVTDTDEARRLVALDDESVFAPSGDIAHFYAELKERFPDGSDLWADGATGSDRVVFMSIRWGADDEDLETIVELAREYDLVLYDPQGPSFHSPADETEGAPPYVPSTGEFLRGVLLVAFGLVLATVAWKLSIPVLSWMLVFVGGFVAVVAVLGLVATSVQFVRARAHQPQ
jgi:hypothetical protein